MRISHHSTRAHWPTPKRTSRPAPKALEWAEDVTGRCARVTAIGDRSLLVENHTGILSFADDEIRLDTRGGPLRVSGSALSLCDVRPGAMIIRGSIRRVELPCRGGEATDGR